MTRLLMANDEVIEGRVVCVHRVSEFPEMYAAHIWDEAIRYFVALVDDAPTRKSAIETAGEMLRDPLAYARCVLAEAVRIAAPKQWDSPSEARARKEGRRA